MKLKMLATAAVAAALSAGCVSTPYYPSDTRVTLAENLGTDIYVRDARCAKINGSDFATFQATVVNNAMHEVWVEYKVDWLDAAGFEIPGLVSTWQNAAIAPKDHKGLRGVAPTRDAVDMRIYMRRLRR